MGAGPRREPRQRKYAICNADESEPGTFKDRQILATQPHLVLEGLLVGMAVVGAEEGWVFIRHEYGPEEHVLREEIDALRAAGIVGPDACGSGRRLDVDVFVSPGGYILGEETALLECMEGHRGEPRNKPPFPGNYGLHGRPTLINSVETFADVPVIVQRGAKWWRDQGLDDSVGWKFFAVSGHVEQPDVYCVPMGTTVRELIDLAGGVTGGAAVGAVQPGGASSNFIGPDQLDLRLDFDTLAEAGTMLGSGALVVLAEGSDLLAASTNVLRFFRDESCGKCVPCRVGSTKAHELLRGVLESGSSTLDDDQRDRILQLEEAMRKTSICGLGQVALGPVVSVLGLDKGGAAARPQPKPGGASANRSRVTSLDPPDRSGVLHRPHRRRRAGRFPAGAPHDGGGGRAGRRAAPGAGRRRAGARRAARLRHVDRRRLRRACRRHLRRVRGTAVLPGPRGRGADGDRPGVAVPPGGCVAMPTGGVLPDGADAVVMVEYTAETMPGTIEVTRPVAPGAGLVRADEDVAAGAVLVLGGRPLRAPDLGLLAAAGVHGAGARPAAGGDRLHR